MISQFYDESKSFLDNRKFQQNLLLLRIEQNIFQVTLLNDIKISNGYEEMLIRWINKIITYGKLHRSRSVYSVERARDLDRSWSDISELQ